MSRRIMALLQRRLGRNRIGPHQDRHTMYYVYAVMMLT